jgi:hypothetical protein
MNKKYIFVTGGVVSGLGKGITAASLGRLLKNRGYKVINQKFDPYINVDPGTMNPSEHGEVFVTEDGAETDLDLGHYERFIDENLNKYCSVTTGKIYSEVIERERKGDYLGKTVQLMADYMTIQEAGLEKDLVVAYVGDGNNMAHSWLNMAAKLGFELRIATPKGYEVDADILGNALEIAKQSGGKIIITNDPKVAIKDSTVVTTDTWVSMGQEAEKEKRVKDFAGYMVDSTMMKLAQEKAIFLHCLPAYRGYEVSDEVMESSQSLIFEEAENRLHAQKGVMVWLDRKRDEK